ncbi:MAG: aminoglycoside 6-adenylyltransferase [Armatimonadetes bacterium]|nr:aminoglycoside 6-adenylyltransferase [Armatimonadota bacterium]
MTLNLPIIEGPEPQAGFINRLAAAFAEENLILACWLHGSFGADSADKFSDIDVAVAVDDDKFYHAFQSAKRIATSIGECVVAWESPKDINGAGFTAFYVDCNFLDVKVYRASRMPYICVKSPVKILFDRKRLVHFSYEPREEENLGVPLSEHVWWKMIYFWICVYSAVRFLKREDYWYAAGMINAIRGTLAQLFWLWTRPDEMTDMSFVVWGIVRRDLEDNLVSELESTVSDAEKKEMVDTLGRLIDLFHRYGRRIAEDTGSQYPEKLVDVITDFYRRECLKNAIISSCPPT